MVRDASCLRDLRIDFHVSTPLPVTACIFQSPLMTKTLHWAVITVTQQTPCLPGCVLVHWNRSVTNVTSARTEKEWGGGCVELQPKQSTMQKDPSYSLLFSLFPKNSLDPYYTCYPEVKFPSPWGMFYLTLFFKNPFSISPSDKDKLTKFNFFKFFYNMYRLYYMIRQRGLKDTRNSTYFLLLVLVSQWIHHFTASDYSASILPF